MILSQVSQCYNGSVSPPYAPATILGNAGVVFGHDLTTEAALTKLFYLLAIPELSYEDVVAQMGLSIRGEMTEASSTKFAHPLINEPSLSSEQAAFTALGYAISAGDHTSVVTLLEEGSNNDLLGASDYAGNTALHLAAIGPDSRILRELLTRGASVHVRNKANNSPLWLAERVGALQNVELLKQSGAHLHVDERPKTPKVTRTNSPVQDVLEAKSSETKSNTQ